MKTLLALLSIILTLAGCFVLLGSPSSERENLSFQSSPDITRIFVNLHAARGSEPSQGISALALAGDNKLYALPESKPDILSFDLANVSILRTDKKVREKAASIYERSGWHLDSIDFIDSQTGFAAGNYGTILRTSDGGATWNQLPRFTNYDITQIKFLNSSVGYIAGRLGTKDQETGEDTWELKLFKTNDGGINWQECYYNSEAFIIFDIAILSPEIAVVSIDGRYLIRSENGGASWQTVKSGITGVTGMTVGANGIAWLVSPKGDFSFSKDKGLSWQIYTNAPDNFLKYKWTSISIGKSGNGISISEDGFVAFTEDNGKRWRLIQQKLDDILGTVQVNDEVGVILGQKNTYRVNFTEH